MMFGHVETVEDRIEHLQRLRDQQDETRRLHRVHLLDVPAGAHQAAAPSRSAQREYLRMQALARIFLDNFPNVQSSWVTQGPKIGQIALNMGRTISAA